MTTIIFRCDSSSQIGSGHIVRCRTIARELKMQGSNIVFVCRKKPGNSIGLIEKEFKTVILEEKNSLAIVGNRARDQYQEWLGCTEEEDANDFLSAIKQTKCDQVDWLIVDHYGLSKTWECIVKGNLQNNDTKVLVIDDLANRMHIANVLIDQNYFGHDTNHRYEDLVQSTCTKLLGPCYAILSHEYAQLNPIIPRREEIKRILIFFGGSDNDSLTLKTLRAIDKDKYTNISFDIVVGMQSTDWSEIQKITDNRKNMTIHTGLNSLAGLIARADLAIGGCGTTTWERACLDLPSIVITVAENQEQIATALHESKWIDLIGKSSAINSKEIEEAVNRHIIGECILNNGKMLTDGYGCKRIGLILTNAEIRINLRNVVKSDEGILLEWANDYTVRTNSFNNETIEPSNHHKWFMQGLMNKNRLHYIATDQHGCPIGQIRFDKIEKDVQIDFSLDRAVRGRGIGKQLLQSGLTELKYKWGNGYNVVGEVLIRNQASSKSFEKAGFAKCESDKEGACKWNLLI